MNIIQQYATRNDCYKTKKTIIPKGLMLHSVGGAQPSAQAWVNMYNRESCNNVCVHAFIDAHSGDTIQILPWNHRGWHCGGTANSTHIGIEMCEPGTIYYPNPYSANFVDRDPVESKKTVVATYIAAVELFAYLCKLYNLDPTKDGVIISHNEGYKRGLASGHADPEHLWKNYGLTMDQFRKDVAAMVAGKTNTDIVVPKPVESITLYRIQVGAYSQKANADVLLEKLKKDGENGFITVVNNLYKVQIGAYSVKANAEAHLAKIKAKGYDAFIATVSGTPSNDKVDPIPEEKDSTQSVTDPAKTQPNTTTKKSISTIALEVLDGVWGNGDARKAKIEAAGYNYAEVQAKVNQYLKAGSTSASPVKSISEIALEVRNGLWGNGDARKAKLEAAGYNYNEVQAAVNKLV